MTVPERRPLTERQPRPLGFSVYLVTDQSATRGRSLDDVVEAALQGGRVAVQLREKDLGAADLLELARRLRAITRRHGVRLLVNDRIDVALAVGADGVHLPARAFPVRIARDLVGPEGLIGVSTHSVSEAEAAENQGADFLVFGPVLDTPSKRPYGPPLGLSALADVCQRVRLPVLAIGGITPDRAADVCLAGAAGIAAIRAILGASDPARVVRELAGPWTAIA